MAVADDREPLGRLVHDTRLANEAERATAEGRERFRLGSWEERSDAQREVDMRIGYAVANYALEQNALTWNTACTGCAALLDSCAAETFRRERAEARLAEVRAVLLEGGQDAATVRRRALALISSEEEADHGG